MDDIKQKLDDLVSLRGAVAELMADKEAKRKAIITPEIKAQLDDLEAEYSPIVEAAQANAAALEDEIKAAAKQYGATIKGTWLSAVFNKGRVTWDSKALDGYAKAHPELAEFRKEGEPYVSIR